jgi:tRNA threonylcarbamoyladenosine biosynthesis protein TsaE
MQKLIIKSKQEMAELAKEIAKNCSKNDVFCLSGTLGAGKSFFAKNFINSLQEKKTEILSPTFNLVYSYKTSKREIFHFDLYRLKSASELENIGFFDALQNGICLIEWPEIAEKFIANYNKINIKIIDEEAREVVISRHQKN